MEAYPEGVPAGKNSGSTRLEPFQGTDFFAVLPGVRHFATTPGFELKRLRRVRREGLSFQRVRAPPGIWSSSRKQPEWWRR